MYRSGPGEGQSGPGVWAEAAAHGSDFFFREASLFCPKGLCLVGSGPRRPSGIIPYFNPPTNTLAVHRHGYLIG